MDNEKLLEQIRKEREEYETLLELKQETDRIKEIKTELGQSEDKSKKTSFASKYVAFCEGFAGAFGIGGKKNAKKVS